MRDTRAKETEERRDGAGVNEIERRERQRIRETGARETEEQERHRSKRDRGVRETVV